MDKFFAWAADNGFNITLSDECQPLPEGITARYGNIPQTYADFAARLAEFTNAGETAWFITPSGFSETDPEKWRYNEFELMSLEAAEGDAEWQGEITEFWNNHLPIVLNVDGGYSYYALSMTDGSIVHGCEPEFEETETVAGLFEEFIEKLISGEIEL